MGGVKPLGRDGHAQRDQQPRQRRQHFGGGACDCAAGTLDSEGARSRRPLALGAPRGCARHLETRLLQVKSRAAVCHPPPCRPPFRLVAAAAVLQASHRVISTVIRRAQVARLAQAAGWWREDHRPAGRAPGLLALLALLALFKFSPSLVWLPCGRWRIWAICLRLLLLPPRAAWPLACSPSFERFVALGLPPFSVHIFDDDHPLLIASAALCVRSCAHTLLLGVKIFPLRMAPPSISLRVVSASGRAVAELSLPAEVRARAGVDESTGESSCG